MKKILMILILSLSLISCDSKTSKKEATNISDSLKKQTEEREKERQKVKEEKEEREKKEKEDKEKKEREEKEKAEIAKQQREQAEKNTSEEVQQDENENDDSNVDNSKKAKIEVHGNVKSKIYHIPGQMYYNRISKKNLIIFKSEEEAIKAGYRKSLK